MQPIQACKISCNVYCLLQTSGTNIKAYKHLCKQTDKYGMNLDEKTKSFETKMSKHGWLKYMSYLRLNCI